MKMKMFAVLVAGMFVSNAFADDWRLRKYDLNYDMVIELSELRESGCRVSNHIFKHADKNGDGVLNRREAQKASTLIFRNKCPRD